ncbi:hypothetical protein Ciccas_014015, partial [Cichlidogyrus casuarinus]
TSRADAFTTLSIEPLDVVSADEPTSVSLSRSSLLRYEIPITGVRPFIENIPSLTVKTQEDLSPDFISPGDDVSSEKMTHSISC